MTAKKNGGYNPQSLLHKLNDVETHIKTSFNDEKEFQDCFVKILRKHGWIIETQRDSLRHTITQKHARCDVIGHHPKYDLDNENLCFLFELKMDWGNAKLTEGLIQLVKYRRTYFKSNTKLFCLITPSFIDWIHVRYFWRFGFGVGNFRSLEIHFPPNGMPKTSIKLDDPIYHSRYSTSFPNPKERIKTILDCTTSNWNRCISAFLGDHK